jgi:hypothetical protein
MSTSKRIVLSTFLGLAGRLDAQSTPPSACSAAIPFSPGVEQTSMHAMGASVGVLDSASMAPLVGRTLSEALAARLPGVSVMRSSGVAGTGSRVRLRGPSGILVPQQPILFIDGIRVEGEAQSIGVDAGGQAPSRLDDVPVENVQCIYVLRGPATTAAYGTDAAGGVIHVITRAVSTGAPRVHGFIEGGATANAVDYPANIGTVPPTPGGSSCSRARAALGQCVAGPMRSWSPLDADSPFRAGPLIHGGGQATVVASRRFSAAMNGTGTLADGALRNNEHTRYTAGATGAFSPDSSFAVRGDLWFMGGHSDLPQVGNFIYSILNSALLGNSVDDPIRHGYRNLPLSVLEEFGTDQRLRRLGGATRVTWKPRRWLSIGAVGGREDSHVRDEQSDPGVRLVPGGYALVPNPVVAEAEQRGQRTTASVSAAASYGPSVLRFSTHVAADYLAETRRRTIRIFDATGQSPDFSSSWSGVDATTKGIIVRQSLASNDRRFLDVGIRRDVLDRDFLDLENPTYPFASAVWDVGRELGLRSNGFLSSLRVRGAYGESGDSRPYETALELAVTVPAPGEPITEQPIERTREIEGGVDVGLFDARVTIDATYFHKRTSDALVQGPIAPGVGVPSSGIASSAAWWTSGAEIAMRARLLDNRTFRADLGIAFTTLKNEVETLGNVPPMVGTTFQIAPGYPLYGAWGRAFTVTDANSDGVIVPAEVVSSPQSRYLGSPVPTQELGITPSVVVGRSITLAAVIDHRSGFRIYNAGGRLRCNAVCAALYDPDASAMEQARAVDPNDALEGWIEDGMFTKLRELSVTWAVPGTWSRRIGARSSALTLVGRNLWTGTDYSGLDPEGSLTGQSQLLQDELFTLALSRAVSLRFDARW